MYDETAVESDANKTVFQEQALLRGFLMHSLRGKMPFIVSQLVRKKMQMFNLFLYNANYNKHLF